MIKDIYFLFDKNNYKVKESLLFLLLRSFISIIRSNRSQGPSLRTTAYPQGYPA